MGNCVLKLRFGEPGSKSREVVRVVTPSSGIMELLTPVTTDAITAGFPGHAIFPDGGVDFFSRPVLHSNDLRPGPKPYYLLPLTGQRDDNVKMTPYRMSCDGHAAAAEPPEVVPKYNGGGVWKVKLVISPQELSEILLHESRTEALIESVRTVAKCGGGTGGLSVSSSDQWSTVSGNSRKGLLVIVLIF